MPIIVDIGIDNTWYPSPNLHQYQKCECNSVCRPITSSWALYGYSLGEGNFLSSLIN